MVYGTSRPLSCIDQRWTEIQASALLTFIAHALSDCVLDGRVSSWPPRRVVFAAQHREMPQ
jgi:hypothetical protein